MESFRYHDLGRIAYADALEYQTAAFEAYWMRRQRERKRIINYSFVSIYRS